MDKASSKYSFILICAALAMITFFAFGRLPGNKFINYDDEKYITENKDVQSGLSLKGVLWAFSTTTASNWHPLTWLSHMLDCQLFGLNPGRHHLVSLLLHIVNTLLLFAVLEMMTGAMWRSAFVAAVFAVHPLHVESVAWASERKDVLSTLFWLLTMAGYVRYVRRQSVVWYLSAVFAFALGLLAKPMLVTLPFALLLLDYWPLGRYQEKSPSKRKTEATSIHFQWSIFRRLVQEKVPFFVLSAVSSIITFIVQRNAGIMANVVEYPLGGRLENVSVSYIKYIMKMICPNRLAILYPLYGNRPPAWQPVLAAILLIAISIWIVRSAQKHKYLPVGWLWYLGTLVPVIGVVHVGAQSMADRYSYIPSIGLLIIAAWGFDELTAKWRSRKMALSVSASIIILALGIGTAHQVRYWQNTMTLFEHALAVTHNNAISHYNVGVELQSQGKVSEAVNHYRQAIQIDPEYAEAHNNLGNMLADEGKYNEAMKHFNEALRIRPKYAEAHNNLGVLLKSQGKFNEATGHFNEALKLRPDFAEAYNNLGIVFKQQNKFDQAISNYRKALQLRPDFDHALNNIGLALEMQGKLNEAIDYYRQALKVKPDYADAHYNIGNALQSAGKLDEAVSHYREAIRVKPDFADAHNNLGALLMRRKKTDEAIECFRQAIKADPKSAESHANLGNAFQEKGKLDEAIKHYREALRIRPDFTEVSQSLAGALKSQGRLDEAVSQLQKGDSNDVESQYILANALASQGKLDEAINYYRRIVAVRPDYADAYVNLGVAVAMKGNIDEAVTAFRQALKLKPDNAETHYNLGYALSLQGKADEAIDHYRQALKINPNHTKAGDSLQSLLKNKK
jgi:tetratricopeptide (TPR) repeat protein